MTTKNMTVYMLVEATPYESRETVGIYFTKEDALAAAEKFKSQDDNEDFKFEIFEAEVGGDPMYNSERWSVML